ncbi:MAG: DUF1987 domain-containing protein [Bacteroidales bacterium]|mgnify:CR=1 FL=1|jgi:hypothetical protein|nr:DUF1987 domain-containing protein [Bacteroidales bacterium]MDD4383666.1 DUF1987 domain-containing protein [Bacteroidales bacterium]MDY0197252.1 DUF1987 domain-containing protein [Tenuifilaceae bacterium]
MRELRIKAHKDSPDVLFDPDTNVFKIKGICHPENVTKFFQPVMDWLDEYNSFLKKSKTTKDIKVIIFFRYFNSATYKYLITLLQKIHEFTDTGSTIFVEWYYESDDEEMRESGEELFEFSGLKIPHKCIESPFN